MQNEESEIHENATAQGRLTLPPIDTNPFKHSKSMNDCTSNLGQHKILDKIKHKLSVDSPLDENDIFSVPYFSPEKMHRNQQQTLDQPQNDFQTKQNSVNHNQKNQNNPLLGRLMIMDRNKFNSRSSGSLLESSKGVTSVHSVEEQLQIERRYLVFFFNVIL